MAMETKFQVGQKLEIISEPGYTGTVVMIDIYEKKYLLDCHPGALGNYVWYKVPDGLFPWGGGVWAANWVEESDLKEISE